MPTNRSTGLPNRLDALLHVLGTPHAIVCFSLLVAACGSGAPKHTPEDTGLFTLHCNQSSLRWNACYQAAERVCGGKGYQIVSEDHDGMPATTTDVYQVPVIGGSMVIRCNR